MKLLEFSDSIVKRFFTIYTSAIQEKAYLHEIIFMKIHGRKFLKLNLLKVSHMEIQELILN
jgi:hypothetical protein